MSFFVPRPTMASRVVGETAVHHGKNTRFMGRVQLGMDITYITPDLLPKKNPMNFDPFTN